MSLQTWKDEFYPVEAKDVSEADALAASLLKWEGMSKKNLKKHGCHIGGDRVIASDGEFVGMFGCSISSCALCLNHMMKTISRECGNCPLNEGNETLEIGCEDGEEAFNINGDPWPMIWHLRRAKKLADERAKQ